MTKQLHELSRSATSSGGPQRRWFSGSGMDLIVWLDDEEEVSGFQFCYEKEGRPLAITWKRGESFRHSAVDEGERNPTRKSSPILTETEAFDPEYVAARLDKVGVDLPGPVARLVADKLRRYPLG